MNAAILLSRCGVLSGNLILKHATFFTHSFIRCFLSDLRCRDSCWSRSSAHGSSITIGFFVDLLNRYSIFFPFHPLSAPLACSCVFHVCPFNSLPMRCITQSWCRSEEARLTPSHSYFDLVLLTNQDLSKAAAWKVPLRGRKRGLPSACLVLIGETQL